MEVFEATRTLLAVRQYQDRPIPEEVIRRIVEAGRLTGSSKNGQPWHFVVVQNRETLQEFGVLARTGRFIADAPLAIVVAVERQSPSGLSDASRAIQSMMLVAWADGVGSNWVGYLNLPQIKPLVGLPDELEVVAIVSFGYPLEEIGKGKKRRKPLAEVAHRERFGHPLE
ncbi:MAG TPA: nitroreductase family protein [Ardenticatenaceae bacterium]|nr:nitroreductase family protein [Ardenticatenaceae bacterium]